MNLEKILNPYYIELLEQIGIPKERNVIQLEFKEKVKRIVFLSAAIGGRAAKKRYMYIDSKDEMQIVGVEAIRSDSCPLQKKVQLACGEMLLRDNPIDKGKIKGYVTNIRVKLFSGKVPIEDLVISKGLQKKLGDYKANTPHRRAAMQMDEAIVGDKIHYLVKGYADKIIIAVPYSKGERLFSSAYIYYWEHHIKPVLERLLIAVFNKEELEELLNPNRKGRQEKL